MKEAPVSDFNPYAPPETDITKRVPTDPGEGVWRNGAMVVCSKNAWFPDRCIKCNEFCGDSRLKKTLRWHPQGYYLLFLISPILYLIVAMIVWWRAKVAFPICERHRRKRIIAIAVAWILPIAGIMMMPLGRGLAATAGENRGTIETVSVIGGFVLIFGGLIYGLVGSRVASTKKIDKLYVWLTGASPEFVASLPTFHGRVEG